MDDLKPGYQRSFTIHCYCERVCAQGVLLQLTIEFQQNQLMTISNMDELIISCFMNKIFPLIL